MVFLSFVNAKAAERGATVIAGSFAPASSIEDAYGLGWTGEKSGTGTVEITLSREPVRIISVLSNVETASSTKDMNVTVKHPNPSGADNNVITLRTMTGGTATDIEHNDRLHFVIIADYSSA